MREAFQNRKFRRLFAGRVITNIGDSFYFVAAMWLVYELTGDPVYTGIAGFVTMIPAVFQFLAGPLVDQWSIRRTLVGTQLIQGAIISLIPIAHVFGFLSVELILIVMPVLSSLNQLVYPAQNTALPRIMDENELVAANSAFSVAYQGIEMVANGIGGVLIGLFGAITLFALDVVTFGIAAIVFASVYIPVANSSTMSEERSSNLDDVKIESLPSDENDTEPPVSDGGDEQLENSDPYSTRLLDGMDAIKGTFFVWLVVGSAIVNMTYGMVLAATPVYADTFPTPSELAWFGPSGVYGILMASLAAGNLIGALSADLFSDRRLGVSMIVGYSLAGTLWSMGLLINWLPLTVLLFTAAFIPNGIIGVQVAAVMQSAPPEYLVGRISSIFGSASASMIPVGSLIGGVIADWLGAHVAIATLGIGTFAFGLFVLSRPNLRKLPAPHQISFES